MAPAVTPESIDVVALAPRSLGGSLCRVRELPRYPKPASTEHTDLARRQRAAALTGSYLADAPVIVSWQRSQAGGPIDVIVGGDAIVSDLDDAASDGAGLRSERAVNLPTGARGSAISAADARRSWDRFSSWTSIEGLIDPLAVSLGDRSDHQMPPPSLEDAVTAVWPGPFAWLLAAMPVPREDIQRESADLSRGIPLLRSKAGNGEEHAIALERQEARYRELQRAELRGLWSIHLVAAGEDAVASAQFAALLCGCVDVEPLPYRFRPGALIENPETLLDAIVAGDAEGTGSAFRGSTDVLAAVASPPRHEVRGIRTSPRPTFDVTPETEGDIPLGIVLDPSLRSAGTMSLSRAALNRHTFVCGATGSGKSQTVRSLLESTCNASDPIPWLVIEPAKSEYRRMTGRLSGRSTVIAIRPGDPDAIAAGLNPLEPEPGFPLQTHLDLTRALFLASFQAEEPFPQILSAALARSYEELGWDLTLSEARVDGVTPRYPTLGDLQRVARDIVTEIGYGPEITQNVRGFVDVRLSSLRHGTPGRFFDGGHPIDIGGLLMGNVILEIEDVGDDQDKAFLIGTVIVRLVEHLRVRAQRDARSGVELRHLTVIEEAHRLLRRVEDRGPSAHAVELFAGLLAEIRAYGEGLIIVEQIPSKIIPDVIKNSAVKVVHRLPAADDRSVVGATMNLSDAQSEYVVALGPGSAAVFADGMDYPTLVRMQLGEERETDAEVSREPPLGGRFSVACRDACSGRACTLREMRRAQRRLEEDGRIVIWAEVAVLAHILGFRSPDPSPDLTADLARLDRRTVECAVAHAADTAVRVRSAEMWRYYSPASLVDHLALLLLAQLDGSPSPCRDNDWRWQAGPFRWNQVRASLIKWQGMNGFGRHPDTDAWQKRYGCGSCRGMMSARTR